MRLRWFALALLLLPLLACSAPAAQPAGPAFSTFPASYTPAATATRAATATHTPAPPATSTPPVAQTSTPPPVGACQLPMQQHLGFGFPSSPHRVNATGEVHAVVLFADFNNAPAQRTPQEVLGIISPAAEQFFAQLSGGRMQLQLDPHLTWLRLSRPSGHYGAGIHAYQPHLDFLQEAVTLADPQVDFSQADLVVLLANPDAYDIVFGPTFTGFVHEGIVADGVIIANGMTSGRDLLYWGHLWLNHEMGHSMGLPDLYTYADEEDIFPYTGGFSLMGNIFGHAPELTAMERWMLGWLDDEQIICHPGGELTATLNAIEQPGGVKAVMVPLGLDRMLVIESRRALGYDSTLQRPGALVYLVDATAASGFGPLRVLPQPNRPLDQAPLRTGESLSFEGVTITSVESALEYDVVRVETDN